MLQDSIQDLNNLVRNIRDDSSEPSSYSESSIISVDALSEIKELEKSIDSSLRKVYHWK